MIDDRLVTWNTARLIKGELAKLQFLLNYETINKEIYDIYNHLDKYIRRNNYYDSNISYGSELYGSLVKHLDNMVDFQRLVESKDSSIDFDKEATERFDNAHVRSTVSVDTLQLRRLELLIEYSSSISILFNNIVPLYESGRTITSDLASEIQEILMNKGLDQFDIPDELLIKQQTQTQDV